MTGPHSGESRRGDVADSQERRTVVGWFYASPITLAAAIILLVIIVGATVVVIISSDDDRAATTPPTAGPTATATTQATATVPAEDAFDSPLADMWGRKVFVPKDPNGHLLEQIELPARNQLLPPPAPQGMMWQSVYGFALPFSTSDGPTRWDGDVATGFSRRPEGSALAGWQLMFRQLGPKSVQQQIAQRYLALTDTERTQFDDELSRRPDRALTEVGPTVSAPDAFRLTSFDEDFAVVEYAVRDRSAIPTTQWAITRAELVWDSSIESWQLKGYSPQLLGERTSSIQGWTQW